MKGSTQRGYLAALLFAIATPIAGSMAAGDTSLQEALERAARARRLGEKTHAVGLYTEILARDPGNRVALYNTGILLENAGELPRAAGIWMQALQADPADLFAYEHLVRSVAGGSALEELIAVEARSLEGQPEAYVRRLRLAVALQQAGRSGEALSHLERVLTQHPASNVAYVLLKDTFASRDEWLAYVDGVSRRAAQADAPTNLKLLHIRLLLERGRVAEADGLAKSMAAESEMARSLLSQAGLIRVDEPARADQAEGTARLVKVEPPAEPEETIRRNGAVAGQADKEDERVVTLAPRPARDDPPPDFGPDNPRSAPLFLERSRIALEARDDVRAVAELRRALHAAPLRLQPRMTLSLLLEQQGRAAEARVVLMGPVEISPWDLYQQAWRSVRDEFIDPDHNGADIYLERSRARRTVRTAEQAKQEIMALQSALGDRYARLFTPELFAHYLLSPNAGLRIRDSGERTPAARPWVDIPAEAFSIHLRPGAPTGRRPQEGSMPSSRAGRPPAAAARDPGVRAAQVKAAMPPGATASDVRPSIGYLALPSLAGIDVARQVEKALASLNTANGLILDLRGNRGGDAAHAVEVAAQFLPQETLVATYLTRRGGQLQLTRDAGPHRPAGPLMVLVDGKTASAAEMLAVALRDQAGATLAGRRTAGKGVGQKALLLADGSGLSITRLELRSPAGTRWDGVGLAPDFPIPGAADDDAVDLAARELLRAYSRLKR